MLSSFLSSFPEYIPALTKDNLTAFLASCFLVYCGASLWYILTRKLIYNASTPFQDSLSEKQKKIQKDSSRLRNKIFLHGTFISIGLLLLLKPFALRDWFGSDWFFKVAKRMNTTFLYIFFIYVFIDFIDKFALWMRSKIDIWFQVWKTPIFLKYNSQII